MASDEELNSQSPENRPPEEGETPEVSPADKDTILDQATLDALLAVEAGQPSPLLDTSPLGGTEGIFDNTPLVKSDPDSLIIPSETELLPPRPSEKQVTEGLAEEIDETSTEGLDLGEHIEGTRESFAGESESALEDLLPQDELDQLAKELLSDDDQPQEEEPFEEIIQEEPEPEALAGEGNTLSQAELDKLIAQAPVSDKPKVFIQVPETMGSMPTEGETLSQDELDLLIQNAMTDTKAETPETPPAPKADSESLSQDELDLLIQNAMTEAKAETTETPPEPKADSESLSQDELDLLIQNAMTEAKAETTETPPEPKADSESLSQDELDLLIQNAMTEAKPETPETPPEPKADSESLSQDELDLLIQNAMSDANAETPETPSAPKADSESLSQDELDLLIQNAMSEAKAETPETPSAPKADSESLSQDELDLLIQNAMSDANAETPETPPVPKADSESLSQDELDLLIQNAMSDANAETPGTPPEPKADSESLSQDELDLLIQNAMSEAKAETPETPPEPKADSESLSQDELDLLLKGALSEETAETPEADSEALSQDELDNLLREQLGSKTAPAPTPSPPEASEPAFLNQEELDRLMQASAGATPETNEKSALTPSDEAQLPADFDKPLANAETAEPTADAEDGILDQASLDALLANIGDSTPTASSEPAKPEKEFLDQSLLDQLLSDLAVSSEEEKEDIKIKPSAAPAAQMDSFPVSGDLSQDMIDALVAAAQSGEESGAVVSENIAAAQVRKEPEAGLLSQADLDALLEQAHQQDIERQRAKQRALEAALSGAKSGVAPILPPEPVETPESKPRKPRRKLTIPPSVRRQLPRIAASLAVGFFVSALMFMTLRANQIHVPEIKTEAGAPLELAMAMKKAKAMILAGDYAGAAAQLDAPLARTGPSPERSDALYLQLEALVRGFTYVENSPEYSALQAKIDEAINEAPAHPRAPEALRWKAKLYEMDGLPYAAQEIYERIIRTYANAPDMDAVLVDAARVAMDLGDAPAAAQHVQKMLQLYPGSPHAQQARLLLGDAYAAAGMADDARTIYVRVAQAEPDSELGADAFLRLARLAFAQGRYADVLPQLETRLATANSLQGNDEAYLLLAKSYRQLHRLEDARNTLNDLVNFFPETKVTPEALIELSQVLEELGQREKALQTAQLAAARYPQNPKALSNKGEFLGLSGNPFAAATALVEADNAGANDPKLLLTAARYYRAAGLLDEADRTYKSLCKDYGSSVQALTGGVEQAQLLYQLGKYADAVSQLENLAQITVNTPHHLPVLLAMSKIYRGLGLDDRVTEISREIAQGASEPEDLAQSALDLLNSGALDEAQQLLDRIELGKLRNASAYQLLTRMGEALLTVDPRRGLARMEEAYLSYPDERQPQNDQELLEAYLAAERSDAARRLVMDLAAQAAERPVNTPYLIDAAISWGDYLYGRADYRPAADAYALAVDSAGKSTPEAKGNKTDLRWAKYQRANALLALSDFQNSFSLFQEIAGSNAPWAKEAGVKAEYARLEQQLRNQPATPTQEG